MHHAGPPLPGKAACIRITFERLRNSTLLLLCFLCLIAHSRPASAQQDNPLLLAATELPEGPSPQIAIQPPALTSTLTGTVVDSNGAAITSARILLTRAEQSASSSNPAPIVTLSGGDGRFTFSNLPPGAYQLTVVAVRFTTRQTPITLHPGESLEVPQIALILGTSIDVQVTASQEEVAQAQIEEQEKQRVLGIIPNFFVSYALRPLPLNSRQKFELAWKTSLDPTSFAAAGFISGIQQADNAYPSWGQGMEGYGKRFGAAYGNVMIGTMIGSAILPSILHQDPRFFYKEGTVRERIKYSFAMAVLCKGDNGNWQFNYSGILGTAAAGGISNLYYPAANRNGAWLTLGNTAAGIAGSVVSNLFQEFLLPRLTPHKPPTPSQP
ncbi:MAG: hypothetical protein JWM43_135 [Acidobacteriaceae bacterium]|nr:hypothetical protein [Acidobacteriaceae bacterium]